MEYLIQIINYRILKKKYGKEKKTQDLPLFQKDTRKYEAKLKIDSDLDSVLKVFVNHPNPLLVKREGNKKVKKRK